MKKPLLVVLLCVFMYGVGLAQNHMLMPTASFTFLNADSTSCTGVPAIFAFYNTSTPGSLLYPRFESVQWDFGDGTTADGLGSTTIDHTYTKPGIYTVTLIVKDTTGTDTLARQVIVNSISLSYSKNFLPAGHFVYPSCGQTIVDYYSYAKSALGGDVSYKWTIHDGAQVNSSLTDSSILVNYTTPKTTITTLTATSVYGNTCFINDTVVVTPVQPTVPSSGARTLTANYQCASDDGWINYYYKASKYADDSLVLSLKTNGNDIGTIGDGTFSVSTVATAGAGSNTAILLTNPLISNQSGFYVMNRYWLVTPTHQPTSSVNVRFYFNNQDVADVNGSYPTHDLNIKNLIFYKTHGGNPDPTTNLAGAEYITSLIYSPTVADTTHWKDFDDYFINSLDKHVAEFQVTSFSGGGGGATGDGQALPVQLTSFTAINNGNKVNLQWTTSQEINVSKYVVQVSADGRQFTTLGTVSAKGNASSNTYAFSYKETKLNQAYYRLLIVEKNGTQTGSSIVSLLLNLVNNNITLYPNPAKNSVQVKAAMFENKTAAADIYNSAGAKVSTATLYFTAGIANLNTSALVSGHYTIVLRNEQSVTHLPLVIVK